MAQGPMSVGAQEAIKFITDKTLTQEDIAADAKVVGEKLAKKFDAAGGTLGGNLSFPAIGDTDVSKKIVWSGSTDGAEIYYQTVGPDHGRLVINLKDDDNCELVIAQNGAVRSFFNPETGAFHGNVFGNALTATSAVDSDMVDGIHLDHSVENGGDEILVYGGKNAADQYIVKYRTLQSIFKASLADYNVDYKGGGYAKFQNGLMAQWGVGDASGYVAFLQPFIDTTYQVMVTPSVDVLHDFYVSGKSTAGFNVKQAGVTSTAKITYLAMGWWRYTKEIEE